MKFRTKSVIKEAIQWTGNNLEEVRGFVPEEILNNKILLITLEGVTTVTEGDWIIRGLKGEFYSCKPDVFKMTYEKIE